MGKTTTNTVINRSYAPGTQERYEIKGQTFSYTRTAKIVGDDWGFEIKVDSPRAMKFDVKGYEELAPALDAAFTWATAPERLDPNRKDDQFTWPMSSELAQQVANAQKDDEAQQSGSSESGSSSASTEASQVVTAKRKPGVKPATDQTRPVPEAATDGQRERGGYIADADGNKTNEGQPGQ